MQCWLGRTVTNKGVLRTVEQLFLQNKKPKKLNAVNR